MAVIEWGEAANKRIHQGIDKVAFFLKTPISNTYGFAWDGVTAVNESPSGAEPTKLYADNRVYNTLYSLEEFAATLEAYQVPVQFDRCDGVKPLDGCPKIKLQHKDRETFVLVYHENVTDSNGDNPTSGNNKNGGIYHIVLGCKAAPSAKDHATINDSPEAATLSYELSTTAVDFTVGGGTYNSAHIQIDASAYTDAQIASLEAALYDNAKNPVGALNTYLTAVYAVCQ